jgi:hypothetical protein
MSGCEPSLVTAYASATLALQNLVPVDAPVTPLTPFRKGANVIAFGSTCYIIHMNTS